MSDDIVTRLRECWCPEDVSDYGILEPCNHDGVRAEAADEIERLRAELDKWQNIAKVLGDGYSLTDEIRPALREVWIKFYSNSPAVMDAI